MIRAAIGALVAAVFPSVPRHLAAITTASQSPVPSGGGEAPGGAGTTPGGEGAPAHTSDRARSAPMAVEQVTPRLPVPMPDVEFLVAWHAHPFHRPEFDDDYLAALLDRWIKEHTR